VEFLLVMPMFNVYHSNASATSRDQTEYIYMTIKGG
jgi:hypothetical protein